MKPLSKTQIFVSLLLKALVVICACVGVYRSAFARGNFMAGIYTFMYFTIQSNIAIAGLCAWGAYLLCRKAEISDTWLLVKFVGTVSITLTGAVFCFVLAPTMGAGAWSPANLLTHVVVPVCSVADFFVTGVAGDLKKRHIFYVVIPPIAYVLFAAYGYVRSWAFTPSTNYPYFFLNWGSPAGAFGFCDGLPFMGCMWWILLLLSLFLLTALGYLALLNRMKQRSKLKTRS